MKTKSKDNILKQIFVSRRMVSLILAQKENCLVKLANYIAVILQ